MVKERNTELHSEFVLQWLITAVMVMMVMMMMGRCCLRAERQGLVLITWNYQLDL